MKPNCKPPFLILARNLFPAFAVLALSTTPLHASGEKSLPAAALKKLDTQLVLALKKGRGESPFDKPTALEPNIPVKYNGRVLVDIQATVSTPLLNQIVLVGGWVESSSATATTLRAWVPFSQLEALAARPDVKFISPAQPIHHSRAAR